jgi:hypothetical protein
MLPLLCVCVCVCVGMFWLSLPDALCVPAYCYMCVLICVSAYCYICIGMSAYCYMCFLILDTWRRTIMCVLLYVCPDMCVRILLYMCRYVRILLYVFSDSRYVASYYYVCPGLTSMCVCMFVYALARLSC